MKTAPKKTTERPIRKEYNFQDAEIGKYSRRFAEGTNVVLLDPDVADAFPDSKSVNDALRSLLRIADRKRRSA